MIESQEKSYTGTFFDFGFFDVKYVLNHSDLITSDQKNFDQKFLTLHFFTILVIFAEKRQSPRKKLYEKSFRFQVLQFLVKNVFIKVDFLYYFKLIFLILRVSIVSLSHVSSFLSTFEGLFASKITFLPSFSSKIFFSKIFSSFF